MRLLSVSDLGLDRVGGLGQPLPGLLFWRTLKAEEMKIFSCAKP